MKTEKTAKEWFEQLPEPIRTQAIEAWEKSNWNTKNYLCESLVDALNNWEWDDYWGDVFNRFVKGEFDTPNLHGWIPVSERLPTVRDADESYNIMVLTSEGEKAITSWVIINPNSITHWQPLPKLPEVKNGK